MRPLARISTLVALSVVGCGSQPPEGYPTSFEGTVRQVIVWSDGTATSWDDEGLVLTADPAVPRRWIADVGACEAVPFVPNDAAGVGAGGEVSLYVDVPHTCAWTATDGEMITVFVMSGTLNWSPRNAALQMQGDVRGQGATMRSGDLSVELLSR